MKHFLLHEQFSGMQVRMLPVVYKVYDFFQLLCRCSMWHFATSTSLFRSGLTSSSMRWKCFLSSTMIPYMWSLRSWTSWYVLRLKLTLHKFFLNLKSELLLFLVYIYFTTTVVNSLEYDHIELTGFSWRKAGCSITVHNKERKKHFYMIVHYQITSFMCMLSCCIFFHIVVGNYCVIPNTV